MARGTPLTPAQKATCREVYAATKSYRAAAKAAGCDDKAAKAACVSPLANGADTEPAAPRPTGRTPTGQFAPGYSGGPGGSVSGTKARRAMVLASITDEEARAIMRALVDAALGGDVGAAAKALGYLIGAPDAEVDTGAGGSALALPAFLTLPRGEPSVPEGDAL